VSAAFLSLPGEVGKRQELMHQNQPLLKNNLRAVITASNFMNFSFLCSHELRRTALIVASVPLLTILTISIEEQAQQLIWLL